MKKVAIAGLILIASMATRSSGWAQGEDSHQSVAPSALPVNPFGGAFGLETSTILTDGAPPFIIIEQ